MPLYEYQCTKCGHRFEKIQQFSDRPESKCPECGGKLEKLISRSAVRFKGSGWYATDYARKGTTPATSDAKSEGSKSEGSKSDSTAAGEGAAKTEGSSKGDTPGKPASEKKSGKK